MPEDKQPRPKGTVNFAAIAKALLHPMQVEILEILAGQADLEGGGEPLAASDMKPQLETTSLAQVSYHCLALLDRKWIKRKGKRRNRGTYAQLYVLDRENIKPIYQEPKRKRKVP